MKVKTQTCFLNVANMFAIIPDLIAGEISLVVILVGFDVDVPTTWADFSIDLGVTSRTFISTYHVSYLPNQYMCRDPEHVCS
jgi:hypothetical protein